MGALSRFSGAEFGWNGEGFWNTEKRIMAEWRAETLPSGQAKSHPQLAWVHVLPHCLTGREEKEPETHCWAWLWMGVRCACWLQGRWSVSVKSRYKHAQDKVGTTGDKHPHFSVCSSSHRSSSQQRCEQRKWSKRHLTKIWHHCFASRFKPCQCLAQLHHESFCCCILWFLAGAWIFFYISGNFLLKFPVTKRPNNIWIKRLRSLKNPPSSVLCTIHMSTMPHVNKIKHLWL